MALPEIATFYRELESLIGVGVNSHKNFEKEVTILNLRVGVAAVKGEITAEDAREFDATVKVALNTLT